MSARAAGAAGPKRPPRAPKRGRWRWPTLPRANTVVLGALAILLLTLAGEPLFLKEVARTLGAVAVVAEGAGALTGAVAHAAANATVAVTSTAASLATSSLSIAREAWVGVDLLKVTANRSHGRVIAESLDEIKSWAAYNPTFANLAVDVNVVMRPAEKVSSSLPLAEWTDSTADVNSGRWTSWRLWSRHLPSGHIAVAFEVCTVTFRARWSNPVWELLAIDPNDSAQEVLRVLSGIVDAMPQVPEAEVSLENAALGFPELPALSPPADESPKSGRRFWIAVTLLLLSALLWFWKGTQCGTAAESPMLDAVVPGPLLINIGTPMISPEHTPPLSPLERIASAASAASSEFADALDILSHAGSWAEQSADLAESESTISSIGSFEHLAAPEVEIRLAA